MSGPSTLFTPLLSATNPSPSRTPSTTSLATQMRPSPTGPNSSSRSLRRPTLTVTPTTTRTAAQTTMATTTTSPTVVTPTYTVAETTVFRLPGCGATGSADELLGPLTMHAYRVEDVVRLYGIPENTIRALIKAIPTSPDPIPIAHFGRSIYLPANAFCSWYLRQIHAEAITLNIQPRSVA